MVEFRYRGREISQEDILYIRALIERHPNESRRTLSTKLCEAWQWRQANGALRDMVCRGMLLMLDRAGQITLPPVSYVRHNPLAKRARPEPAQIDTTPIEDRLRNLQPLEFEQVRRTSQEPLFNSLMEEHHYLGYEQPVGEHLKYLVWAQGRPVACLAWSSAPRHLGSRDRYIGWSAEARRRNIRFIAYNTRFLILPWVRVEHLASHILGRMAARISDDWQRMYGHPIYFLETFVDPERFRGTCYRAANWVLLGKTTGRGKQSNSYVPNRSIKEVLGYPLTKRFRELLGGGRMKSAKRRRVDVNLDELDRVLDGARQAPLSEADCDKLKSALHALAAMLVRPRNTEKTSAVLEAPESSATATGISPIPTRRLTRTRTQRRGGVWRGAEGRHCSPGSEARGPLPGVRQRATCTDRRSRRCWFGSWGRRRWRPRSTRWSGCDAARAGRYLRRKSRKA